VSHSPFILSCLQLNGTLRGFDAFLNAVVLEDAVDEKPLASSTSSSGHDDQVYIGQIVIRGNSISQFETLERVKA